MNSKRMLLRLLRLGLLSLLFVHQTRPASSIKESVKKLIVERSPGTYDSFTVNMKPNRTCGEVGSFVDTFCTALGAHLLSYTFDRRSCKCQCRNYQPYTFLSSKQRCANTNQVRNFGGEFNKHHTVNLYITKSSVKRTIFFAPLQAPWPFVASRFCCSPGLSGTFFFATESLPLTRDTGGCFY